MQHHGKLFTQLPTYSLEYEKYRKISNFTFALFATRRIQFNWHYYVRQHFMTEIYSHLLSYELRFIALVIS